jgi:hypothetical protein
MASETLIKCAHAPCQCLVEAEQQFCSATCASARGGSHGACLCGHAGCTEERNDAPDRELEAASEESEPGSPHIE